MTDKPFRKWFIRTVHKGRVRIMNTIYAPDETHMAYDGRLDGLRFLFGRYRYYGTPGSPRLLALWGTEAACRDQAAAEEYGPECVDGKLPWYFWHEMMT